MKIHIIQPAIPSYRNAFFKQLSHVLSQQNVSIVVYAAKLDHLGVSSIVPSGYEYKLDSKIQTFFGKKALWQTKLNFSLNKGDILVIDGNPRWLNNYLLLFRAKIHNIPVIWWGQGWSVGSHGVNAKIRQIIMKLTNAIILYTDWEHNQYIKLGFSPQYTFALNNSLDTESIKGEIKKWDNKKIELFKKNNDLNHIDHWCAFIGRVTEKSEICLLVESLSKTCCNVGLIVIGDGPMVNNAKEKAQKLGISHKIIWAGAQFNEEAIAPWMLSASAFVYPGAVGLSLIHAFAYGLPAIIYNDREKHGPEFSAFEHEKNGISFEHGSVKSLTEAIDRLITDDDHRKLMSDNAATIIQKTFNVNDMTNRFVKALNSVSK